MLFSHNIFVSMHTFPKYMHFCKHCLLWELHCKIGISTKLKDNCFGKCEFKCEWNWVSPPSLYTSLPLENHWGKISLQGLQLIISGSTDKGDELGRKDSAHSSRVWFCTGFACFHELLGDVCSIGTFPDAPALCWQQAVVWIALVDGCCCWMTGPAFR